MSSEDHRWLNWLTPALVGAVLAFILANLPTYYEIYKKWFVEPLAVSISSWGTGRAFYRIYPIPGGQMDAIPVETFIYVYVANKGDSPIRIRSYSVSAKVHGKWERLIPLRYLPDERGTIVTFWRNQGIMEVDLARVGFDYKATQGGITRSDRLHGWMFFENQPTGKVDRFRFELVDSANDIHTLEIPAQVKKEGFANLDSALIPLGPARPIPDSLRKFLRQ